jgi:type I restriction-modification system DNA methylase subunit
LNPHQKALVKLLTGMGYRHHLYNVFADFMELAALAVSNSVDLLQFDAREARYKQIIAKYEAEEQSRFPVMLAELVMAMETGPDDILGRVFGELDLGNAAAGQFFTPYEVCRLMASITVADGADMRERIQRQGFVTAQEPACGAGAQVIALAEAMQLAGFNYQEHLHVTAIDVDARAAHMAYLQFSLLHIPAVVIVGNTLTLEQRERWYTPAHIIGMWDAKLRRGYALGAGMDGAERPAPQPDIRLGQLGLFEEAAA